MKLKNKTRLILQVVVLTLVVIAVIRATDVEAFCPLGGLLSIGSRFVRGASSCQMGETQMFLGISLVLGIFVVGKLFCSHICPIGTVSEWLGRWGRKFKIQLQKMPRLLDRSLRMLKYALLLPVLYYTVTSSELFCKTFDPYYAATTGFGLDVVFWWALPALVLVIAGSLFVRQFWCKYLCPLGALSNLVLFAVFTFGTLGIYVVLNLTGLKLSVFWLFLVWITGGFLMEISPKKLPFFSLIKIKRDNITCIDCKLCDKVCPYDIEVSRTDVLQHADCTMCIDCVAVCPVKNCLKLRRFNWQKLPAFATALLVFVGIGISTQYELQTISERWGNAPADVHLTHYESIIKSVKCFGTATALKRKIERRKGIYGVDAYATSHKVVIYYNPSEIDETGIKKAVFSPYKSKIRNFGTEKPPNLQVAYFGVLNLNDSVDNLNLFRILAKSKHIYGFQSDFGEPVRVLIYYDGRNITPRDIVKLIESPTLKYVSEGKETETALNFKVFGDPEILGEMTAQLFLQHIFVGFNRKFKEFKTTSRENISIYEAGIPGLEAPAVRRYLPYLMSHISRLEGVVGLETYYTTRSVAWIYFDISGTDSSSISRQLSEPKMTVSFSNGETREFDNPFKTDGRYYMRTLADVQAIKAEVSTGTEFLSAVQEGDIAED
jgi:Pyruvate/2-oxoacid:ferredoxin oxidoreductase delta subunit